MTTALRNTSLTRITTELLFNDVVTNTTPSWHGIDNATETFQVQEGCLLIPHSAFLPDNSPEDLVSYETRRHVWKFVDVYFLLLCVFVSVPTNVINMIVFWKHGIKARINLCLFCLSLVDLLLLVSQFLMYAEEIYATISKTTYTRFFLKYLINNMFHTLPTVLTTHQDFFQLWSPSNDVCAWSALSKPEV